jgi:hypothetical protein
MSVSVWRTVVSTVWPMRPLVGRASVGRSRTRSATSRARPSSVTARFARSAPRRQRHLDRETARRQLYNHIPDLRELRAAGRARHELAAVAAEAN